MKHDFDGCQSGKYAPGTNFLFISFQAHHVFSSEFRFSLQALTLSGPLPNPLPKGEGAGIPPPFGRG